MKTEEEIKGAIEGTKNQIIHLSRNMNKKNKKTAHNMHIQLGVLNWILADTPPKEEAQKGTTEDNEVRREDEE